jgi:hypothetical protein
MTNRDLAGEWKGLTKPCHSPEATDGSQFRRSHRPIQGRCRPRALTSRHRASLQWRQSRPPQTRSRSGYHRPCISHAEKKRGRDSFPANFKEARPIERTLHLPPLTSGPLVTACAAAGPTTAFPSARCWAAPRRRSQAIRGAAQSCRRTPPRPSGSGPGAA